MEPAASIIRKLGGNKVVAEHLGLHPVSVAFWKQSREKRGTGGLIPMWHVHDLHELAAIRGVALSPADFMPPGV